MEDEDPEIVDPNVKFAEDVNRCVAEMREGISGLTHRVELIESALKLECPKLLAFSF